MGVILLIPTKNNASGNDPFASLVIVFSDFLGPILIVGGAAYLLARWLLG